MPYNFEESSAFSVTESESEVTSTYDDEESKESKDSGSKTGSKTIPPVPDKNKTPVIKKNIPPVNNKSSSGKEINVIDYNPVTKGSGVKLFIQRSMSKMLPQFRGTTLKNTRWHRFRRKFRPQTVTEVREGHSYFYRLKMISVAYEALHMDKNSVAPLEEMKSEHFKAVWDKELALAYKNSVGDKVTEYFRFESFAPRVFGTIRRAMEVDEDAYKSSLIGKNENYLEFISNSRSGMDFFFTHDLRFMVKTITKTEVETFLKILQSYLEHFMAYPHSLLVKMLACDAISFFGDQKIYIIVMQNIFYPPGSIQNKFDLKGCLAGRFEKPKEAAEKRRHQVFKDQNFLKEELELGNDSRWFVDQITADANFLRSWRLIDYSLLVGRQKLQKMDQKKSFPLLIERLFMSRLASKASIGGSTSSINHWDEGVALTVGFSDVSVSSIILKVTDNGALVATSTQHPGIHMPRKLGMDHTLAVVDPSRRRLVPSCANPLHVIDGPHFRYHLGIIDFLTEWSMKQQLGRAVKNVKFCCGDHSTQNPDVYCERFVRFLSEHVKYSELEYFKPIKKKLDDPYGQNQNKIKNNQDKKNKNKK